MPTESALLIGPEAKAALAKLPSAEVVAVLEGLYRAAKDNNNNIHVPDTEKGGRVSSEELLNAMETVPTDRLRGILKSQGIIE